MNYQLIIRKIQYYCDWYNDMNIQEKRGWLGHWVKERIKRFDEVLEEWYRRHN